MRSTHPRIAISLILSLALAAALAGQAGGPRFALVIGNGGYAELPRLNNPANDARDMAAALERLGFAVKLLVDADLGSMEDATLRLSASLSRSADSIGFFFYAGHGVQSGGINYLIPAYAHNSGESFLKTEALSAQFVLDILQGSRNWLNIVVLDACRDNPFSWGRGGPGGLSMLGRQPADSIVAYATSAGSIVQDEQGGNGVYTAELLKQIKTPGLEIAEVFRQTAKAVQAATAGRQIPALYNRFAGKTYLAGAKAAAAPGAVPAPSPAVAAPPPSAAPTLSIARAFGSLRVTAATAGSLYLDGTKLGELTAGTRTDLANIEVGERRLELRYAEGSPETKSVIVSKGQATVVSFSYKKASPAQAPAGAAATAGFVRVPAGSFTMGSPASEKGRSDDEGPQHEVRLSAFSIGRYEVTVAEFRSFIQSTGYRTTAEREGGGYVYQSKSTTWKQKADANWKNPYMSQTDRNPAILVSFYDCVEYCNWRSKQEGLRPCYTIIGTSVSCDFDADGYRLPTEAEWEYAAKGGQAAGSLALNAVFAGSAVLDSVGWYGGNSGNKTHPAGQKKANALGLFDMAGNVWEWCWDWYEEGYYARSPSDDPQGADAGEYRVLRGGSWHEYDFRQRSTVRNYNTPSLGYDFCGFRLVVGR